MGKKRRRWLKIAAIAGVAGAAVFSGGLGAAALKPAAFGAFKRTAFSKLAGQGKSLFAKMTAKMGQTPNSGVGEEPQPTAGYPAIGAGGATAVGACGSSGGSPELVYTVLLFSALVWAGVGIYRWALVRV